MRELRTHFIRLSVALLVAVTPFTAFAEKGECKRGIQITVVLDPGAKVRIRTTFSRPGRNDNEREQSVMVFNVKTAQILHGWNSQFGERWHWEHACQGNGGVWEFENTSDEPMVLNINAQSKSSPNADIEWTLNSYRVVYQKPAEGTAYVGWTDGPAGASEMRDEVVEVTISKKAK